MGLYSGVGKGTLGVFGVCIVGSPIGEGTLGVFGAV